MLASLFKEVLLSGSQGIFKTFLESRTQTKRHFHPSPDLHLLTMAGPLQPQQSGAAFELLGASPLEVASDMALAFASGTLERSLRVPCGGCASFGFEKAEPVSGFGGTQAKDLVGHSLGLPSPSTGKGVAAPREPSQELLVEELLEV